MAKGIRVDAVTIRKDGGIEVSLTYGDPPLSTTPQGLVLDWPNRESIGAELREFEEQIGARGLVLMALSDYVNQWNDPNLKQLDLRFPGREKTISFDVAPASSIVG